MKNLPNDKALRFSFQNHNLSSVGAEVLDIIKWGNNTMEVREVVVHMVVMLATVMERVTVSLPPGWLGLGSWRRAGNKRVLPSAFGHPFLNWLFSALGLVFCYPWKLYSQINHTCWL